MPKTKESLRQQIIHKLTLDLDTASKAADTARNTATSKETVAENKYDTFGLEASYLAHGQSKRVLEFQEAILRYQKLAFKDFTEDDAIDITAVITLNTADNTEKYFFLGPEAGGLKIQWDSKEIMIITPTTPLGKQLLDKHLDDTIELFIANKALMYEIVSIE